MNISKIKSKITFESASVDVEFYHVLNVSMSEVLWDNIGNRVDELGGEMVGNYTNGMIVFPYNITRHNDEIVSHFSKHYNHVVDHIGLGISVETSNVDVIVSAPMGASDTSELNGKVHNMCNYNEVFIQLNSGQHSGVTVDGKDLIIDFCNVDNEFIIR